MAANASILLPHKAARRHDPPVLQLAGVVVRAFEKVEPRGKLGRWAMWVGTVTALWAYERRVHDNGHALCLLGVKWGRVVTSVVSLVLITAVADALVPEAAIGLLGAISLVFLPLVLAGLRALPARLRLGRVGLRRGRYLHSMVSEQPGAGAEVLKGVCAEADSKGWHLVLDASCQRLVVYYEQFGFETSAGPVKMPNGHLHTRMFRPIAAAPPLHDFAATGRGQR